jgi:colanic acid/amylovoran biosynthesis protein
MHNNKVAYSFFAVSRTGNRGAVSMLESAIDHLVDRAGDGFAHVFTVYPEQDRKMAKPRENTVLHSGTPLALAFRLIPLSILCRLLQGLRLPIPKRWLGRDMAALLESEVVIIAGGTTFSDAQKFKVLYNVACIAPAIILGKKSMLYSQTIGPMKHPWTRFWAKLILPRVDVVAPRGRESFICAQELGLKSAKEMADSAFTLVVPEEAESRIRQEYSQLLQGKKVVGISVNTIVQRKCSELGIDHHGEWTKFLEYLQDKGYFILMIPHSMRPGSKSLHNNDLVTVQEICQRLRSQDNLHVVDKHYDCKELRVLVGLADYYVASRFHSMISALCTGVPVAVFGWGFQKYREVMADFELEEYCNDAAELSAERLIAGFELVQSNRESIRQRITKNLPKVRASSQQNHDEAFRLGHEACQNR